MRTNFMARYELSRNFFVSGNSAAADNESLRNNLTSKVSLSFIRDDRNNFADPKKGFKSMAGVDIFNEVNGNHANFVEMHLGETYLYTFWDRLTLTNDLRFDEIFEINSSIIPQNERLYLGGDTSIRGFAQDAIGPQNALGKPVGGKIRWIYNAELAVRLVGKFKVAAFYDMGSLTDHYSSMSMYNIRNSAGLGLRYITPVGPLRLDYGFKLDRRRGEGLGRLHFTFGYML